MIEAPATHRPVLRWEQPGVVVTAGTSWLTFDDGSGTPLRLGRNVRAFGSALVAALLAIKTGVCTPRMVIADGRLLAIIAYLRDEKAFDLFYGNNRSMRVGIAIMADIGSWLSERPKPGWVTREADRFLLKGGGMGCHITLRRIDVHNLHQMLLRSAGGEKYSAIYIPEGCHVTTLHEREHQRFHCTLWPAKLTRAQLVFLAEELHAALEDPPVALQSNRSLQSQSP